MPDDDVTEELDTDVHRLRPGDKLWVKIGSDGVASNPFSRGHDQIHVDAEEGETVFVEVTEIPGEIQARVIHRKQGDKGTGGFMSDFESNHDEKIVWRGTDHDPTRREVEKRVSAMKEGDVRGSKNDLLDGHL